MNPVLLAPLLSTVGNVVDKLIPDTEKRQAAREQAQLEVLKLASSGGLAELEAAAKVIVAEAQGESWLQRNWRPIVMLAFTLLIAARWLGLSAPGLDHDLELKLFEIVQLGLGGYVIGRSAEKVVREWKKGEAQ